MKSKKKFEFMAYLAPPPENWDEFRTPDFSNPNYMNDEQYSYVAEAGFTHLIAMYEHSEERAIRALKLAERHKLKYYVKDWDVYGENLPEDRFIKLESRFQMYQHYPAFAGLIVDDEPDSSRFENIARLKAQYNRMIPGRLFFVNLLPNYATAKQLGAETYEEYIDRYVDVVNPDDLMFDFYPICGDSERETYLMDGWIRNLEIVANKCRERSIPLRTFIQSIRFGGINRDTSEQDIRFEIFVNIAYGASGILYFTYWTPFEAHRTDSIVAFEALITVDGEKTFRYEAAKKINNEIHSYEDVFLSYKWQGCMAVKADDGTENPNFSGLSLSLKSLPQMSVVTAEHDLLIGSFVRGGDNAYMVVNFSDPGLKRENRVRLYFTDTDAVTLYAAGEKRHEKLSDGLLELTLPCGDGVFIQI